MAVGPSPGDVLGERYVLKRNEWMSPLGPVWLGRDRVLDRAVFVQLLSSSLSSKPPVRRTFQKAAARIAQIGAPGLLQVYDIGEDPPFAVLEHASGGRLSDRMNAGPMRPTDAARTVLTLARGLEALHERGTWHGSLSPNTVLFDEEGRAKLFAVGLADTARAAPRVKIEPDQPASYRPPEADPLPVDADRYALAALLYQMVTGSAPEAGVPARAKRRGIPVEIDELLQRALSPDPKQRPELDEFEGALAPFARVIPTDVKQPRFAVAEFRWLVPVVLIVVLAIVALTFGVQFAKNLGTKDKAKATPSAATPGAAIHIKSAKSFDPPPLGNGDENEGDVSKAFDGEPATDWSTFYYTTADVGGKKGIGLLFDLGAKQTISTVELQTSTPGWSAQIRIADQAGDQASDFEPVKSLVTGSGTTRVSLPAATNSRYVLLWITELTRSRSGKLPYSADVSEIEFFSP